jgi:transcription elongation factor Elf1
VKKIIKPLFINIIISALFGIVSILNGYSFFYTFGIAFLSQYVLYSFISTLIVNFYREKTKQLELQKLENLSTILECAYCNAKNILTFIPDQNEKLEFVCNSCEKTNNVIMQFTVIRQNDSVPIQSLLTDENKN